MSIETLQAIEDAIIAHHRDETEDNPDRMSAVVTSWVVGYEISNVIDFPDSGTSVVGYANSFVASDSSPNTIAHLAQWTADEVSSTINGADLDDD